MPASIVLRSQAFCFRNRKRTTTERRLEMQPRFFSDVSSLRRDKREDVVCRHERNVKRESEPARSKKMSAHYENRKETPGR